jgi:hypothetical protein
MKKIITLISTVILACSFLSANERLFSFTAGLSSGVPIYGANSVVSTGSEISQGNRIILGTNIAANVNPFEQVTFYLGNDTIWDYTWNASEKSSKVHLSIPLGIKIYPGLGGLNLGLAYTLGIRFDNVRTEETDEYNGVTPWGNGFKFQMEYNFVHEGNNHHIPSIGGYWNLMPRGNNAYDNLIVLYVAANF